MGDLTLALFFFLSYLLVHFLTYTSNHSLSRLQSRNLKKGGGDSHYPMLNAPKTSNTTHASDTKGKAGFPFVSHVIPTH